MLRFDDYDFLWLDLELIGGSLDSSFSALKGLSYSSETRSSMISFRSSLMFPAD